MNDEANTMQREKRHAVLYFSPKNSKAYKELAARVRSDGGRTTLVWSNQWKGAESILPEARGVIIERGCKNADDIVEAYRRYANDVEIHYTDANGEFTDGEEAEPESTTEGDDNAPPITEETVTEDGATPDEEEHDDPDTTSDAVVEETATEEGGEDTSDSDGDGEDAGTADDSGEAGAAEPASQERTTRD